MSKEFPSIFDESLQSQSRQLAAECSIMASIIEQKGYLDIRPKSDHFYSLCQAIASQQLSTKAAQTIFSRVVQALENEVIPEKVLNTDHDMLRACGLSNSKVSYVKDLAQQFYDNKEEYEKLEYHSDQEIIEKLTRIKGIGKWSAQMFLIFSLGRPDVFPEDDLGIRNAVKSHFPETVDYKPKQYLIFSERWAPKRTLASLYLWKGLT